MKLGKNTLIIRPKQQWKKPRNRPAMKCSNVGKITLRKKGKEDETSES